MCLSLVGYPANEVVVSDIAPSSLIMMSLLVVAAGGAENFVVVSGRKFASFWLNASLDVVMCSCAAKLSCAISIFFFGGGIAIAVACEVKVGLHSSYGLNRKTRRQYLLKVVAIVVERNKNSNPDVGFSPVVGGKVSS